MSIDRMAFEDPDFMNSQGARGLRILAEYERFADLMRKHGIENTIVFFGSARSKPEAVSQLELDAVRQSLQNPIDDADRARLERLFQVAQQRVRLGRYHDECTELARRLAEWGMQNNTHKIYHLCSGGGPGIMEAANRGASLVSGAKSLGLGIKLPFEQSNNTHVTAELSVMFKYFFIRKFWLTNPARALVAGPGGMGTLDELCEILTLKQTGREHPEIPILLYGREFWEPFIGMVNHLIDWGTCAERDRSLFHVSDSVDEAFEWLTSELIRVEQLEAIR